MSSSTLLTEANQYLAISNIQFVVLYVESRGEVSVCSLFFGFGLVGFIFWFVLFVGVFLSDWH